MKRAFGIALVALLVDGFGGTVLCEKAPKMVLSVFFATPTSKYWIPIIIQTDGWFEAFDEAYSRYHHYSLIPPTLWGGHCFLTNYYAANLTGTPMKASRPPADMSQPLGFNC